MEPFRRFATAKTIGSITIKPASKKMGKPRIRDATPKARGARFSPKRLIMASARTFAPPDCSTILPSMAPKPTSSATEARVPPKPSFIAPTIDSMGKPVAKAVRKLTKTKVRKAWSLNTITRTKIAAIAAKAMPSSGNVPIVWVHPSISNGCI